MVNNTFELIRQLVLGGDFRISEHGYDELAADGLMARDVIEGMSHATIVEDYPNYPKGPCVLLLQSDSDDQPLHVLWGIPRGEQRPAVLITAYRPDPLLWDDNFLRRRT